MPSNCNADIARYLEAHSEPEPNSGCLIWMGAIASKNRYGHFRIRLGASKYQFRYAHREAYRISHGPIPKGLMVLHSCDVPTCINPDHLSVGTHARNQLEKAERRRSRDRSLPSHVSLPSRCRAYLFKAMHNGEVTRFVSRDLRAVERFRDAYFLSVLLEQPEAIEGRS